MSNAICMMRMYSSKDYLENHVGHEAINLMKADDGSHYVYMLSAGDYCKDHFGKIKSIVLVSISDVTKTVEILGVASDLEPVVTYPDGYTVKPGLEKLEEQMRENGSIAEMRRKIHREQLDYITSNNVTYGGKRLDSIYKKEAPGIEDSVIYITFKAGKFLVPKDRMYLTTNDPQNKNEYKIVNGNSVTGHSQLMYFYESGNGQKVRPDDYSMLRGMINDPSLWEDGDTCPNFGGNIGGVAPHSEKASAAYNTTMNGLAALISK